ncbi:HlyD family secretion protein [Schlegelella sp. S2-27]|uniref:HlyD family secretion protein n=1 Tax=Caldimonas mangrovi TaxID=2944811 RepID=A0ABT0YMP4_9BURK|nr:HlyD family efflux transporter periplasmic adaptor subunit [Caldimonas mangrovi]MCM5680000.1 HlyD family secretion protein [Caldimonas mangrovi]
MNARDAVSPLLTLLQLARRARAAATLEELGFVAVNETLQLLPYRQAVLWSEQGLARVAAVSGLPQPDPTAPYVQWAGKIGRHAMRERWPAQGFGAVDLPEPLQAEWSQWWPEHALWLPLGRPGEPADAGLVLVRERAWPEAELALAKELADAYGHALAAFKPRRSGLAQAGSWLRGGKARRRLVIAALVLCLVPMRLTVLAPAEVTAKDPFLVRAPLDGVIDRFDVQPNQPVHAGTPLFSLDITSLQARHDVARKAYDTALEEYRQSAQAAVTDDKSRIEIALSRGKLQERSVELEYTAQQLARIQVKAERDGVAVFADTSDWLGRAVAIGERILLIADPRQVELTAHLPAGDHIAVQAGDVLTLYPQGSPLSAYEARIVQVAYRAEPTAEGFLAYRLKADFLPGQAPPRLGQMGTARLEAGWAPLIYIALRRPLVVARQWLGW